MYMKTIICVTNSHLTVIPAAGEAEAGGAQEFWLAVGYANWVSALSLASVW